MDDNADEVETKSAKMRHKSEMRRKYSERKSLSITSQTVEVPVEVTSCPEPEDEVPEVSMRRLFGMNSPEWPFMLVGCLAAFSNGLIDTGNAFLFVKIFAVSALNPFTIPCYLTGYLICRFLTATKTVLNHNS